MLQRQGHGFASLLFQQLSQLFQAAGGLLAQHRSLRGTLLQPTLHQGLAAGHGNGFLPALALQLPTHGL